jgi:hypothetical protein
MLRTIFLTIVVAFLSLAEEFEDWTRVRDLPRDERLIVTLRDGRSIEGTLHAWSAEGIDIRQKNGEVRSADRSAVLRVGARRKGSRAKAALWGTLIGFGIAFPIGAASAGYLADQNNPSIGTRAGYGGGVWDVRRRDWRGCGGARRRVEDCDYLSGAMMGRLKGGCSQDWLPHKSGRSSGARGLPAEIRVRTPLAYARGSVTTAEPRP